MTEKTLNNRKNGMAVLLLLVLVYVASVVLFIFGVSYDILPLTLISCVWFVFGWIFFLGLKVLKPQEALVLTLFGKYVGTLKNSGFYFVNPFCTAVNPAAGTKLNQSGDVKVLGAKQPSGGVDVSIDIPTKKISLKIMTLNNNRQKINDCLGNPVEIGIAVMWRVVDTAKAVFNVDNYKEYLSLQCDSALRNIVRIYPYDIAPNVDTTGDGIADEGPFRAALASANARAESIFGGMVPERYAKAADYAVRVFLLDIIYRRKGGSGENDVSPWEKLAAEQAERLRALANGTEAIDNTSDGVVISKPAKIYNTLGVMS